MHSPYPVGYVQLLADIARIEVAARVRIRSTYDRQRRSHRVDARTQADALAFQEAAERLGLDVRT